MNPLPLPADVQKEIIDRSFQYGQTSQNKLVARLGYQAGATEWANKWREVYNENGKLGMENAELRVQCDELKAENERLKEDFDRVQRTAISYANRKRELEKQREEAERKVWHLTNALQIIANWQLPSTGQFWDKEETQPMSFEAAYGSNGARDFIRNVANEALSSWEGKEGKV